ncbi:MAG: tetratricopeptide repeat protein, partial [Tepidimonas taiwanensis]|nr:tetratricopeptide repeat protein [Tepidimonas taiwanensis]
DQGACAQQEEALGGHALAAAAVAVTRIGHHPARAGHRGMYQLCSGLYAFLWIIPWVGWMSIDIRVPFPTQWFSIQLLGALGYLGLVIYAMWVMATRRGFVSLLGIVVLIPAVLFVTEFAYVRLQEPFVLYRSYMWFFTLPVLAWLAVYYLSEFRSVVLGVLVILIFGFTLLSYERVGSFRNEYTVWKDAVEKLDLNAGSNVFGRWRAPLNFSLALINMGSNEEGLRYAALSDRLGAPNGLAKFNQAAALSNLGQLEAALDFYNKAELDGFTLKGSLYKDKGLVLAKLGRYDDALENFDLALTLLTRESERSQTLLAAGRAANSAGEYRRAISYYQQLSELQPDATAVPIGVAFANYKLGNVDAALDALNRSLAKKPTAEVLHARAFIFKELGNKGRALNDINVAIVLAPQNPIYQQFRDQILKD